MSGGKFFLTLVAMLLRVVPFFLIPGLVKSSMSALGNLGAKISGIGSRFGSSVTGSARKSDAFQRGSEFGEQLRGRGIAARHKILGKITGGKYTGSKGSKRRLARAIGAQEARIRGDAKAAAIAGGGFISNSRTNDIYASARDAEETQGIKDAENGFRLDPDFDAGNHTEVNNRLKQYLEELNQNPDDIVVRRKVKALTKILLESDDGRGDLARTVQEFAKANTQAVTDENGRVTYQSSKAVKDLGKYLGSGENMSKIKGSGQRGLKSLVDDINRGNNIRTSVEYGAAGVDKFNAAGVGDIDITSLESQVAAAQADALSGETLHKLTDIYRRAIASENAGNLISGESLAQINKLLKEEHRQNTGSYDGFQEITFETSSSNSGTVQIHGNNSNSNGPIVQTGNDARPRIILGDSDDLGRLSQDQDIANRQRGGRRNF